MRITIRHLLFLILFLVANLLQINAIDKTSLYEKYINKYSDEAVRQQKKYGIPASITLAQALLESNAGESTLARNAHNHFGIKCHTDWDGQRAYHDDETNNECFRKYRNVKDSYEDHSRFLSERPRYSGLFAYKETDYKSWAKGLQESGYATDKGYATKLINIIETYELYNIGKGKVKEKSRDEDKDKSSSTVQLPREIYRSSGLIYVIANEFDSVEKIADDLGFKAKKLYKFNDLPNGYPVEKGDIVYLEKKNAKADNQYQFHTVKPGESLHSVSQRYGIQLKRLYKLNKLSPDFVPVEGDILKLR